MAFLYISEYQYLAIDAISGRIAAPKDPPVATQQIAIGVGSAASAAFNARTKFIEVHTDAVCSIATSANPGATPTAVATARRMAAGETRYYGVEPDDKIAVITHT